VPQFLDIIATPTSMTTKQIKRDDMIKTYKKAVSDIVVGGKTRFKLASKNHRSENETKGGIKKIEDDPQFDHTRNQLRYNIVGCNGGNYIMYINFDDKRVYHAHESQPEQKSEVFILDMFE
jgi:hypothetical protein